MLNDYRNKTLRAILSTGYQNMKKLSVEDVTNEYLDKALPNQGSLTRAPGFKEKDHSDEIQVGNFIFSYTFFLQNLDHILTYLFFKVKQSFR